jgi:hypothetical protein
MNDHIEIKKDFDAVQYFREIKEKIGMIMFDLPYEKRKEFIEKIINGEIGIELIEKYLKKEIQFKN